MQVCSDTSDQFWKEERQLSLGPFLAANGVGSVFIAGVSLDYCVGESALEAKRLGFNTYVVQSASCYFTSEGA